MTQPLQISDPVKGPAHFRETPDIESSSDRYALRFSGAIGSWFLEIQQQATLRLLGAHPGASVLDVGGGHGQITRTLIDRDYRLTILGSSPGCIKRVAVYADGKRCYFTVGDILDLPYRDHSFDIVVSYRLLSHVVQWRRLIAELTRVARHVVLVDYTSTRSMNCLAPLLFRIKKRIEGDTRRFALFTERELLAAFEAAGFKTGGRYAQFFFPMALHRLIGSPSASFALESCARVSGAAGLFGSPVLLRMQRS